MGLFLLGVLTGTEEELGDKEEKKGEKLEHLKTPHAPISPISYGIRGVIQGSRAKSSVPPGALELEEMPKETGELNEPLRSEGYWWGRGHRAFTVSPAGPQARNVTTSTLPPCLKFLTKSLMPESKTIAPFPPPSHPPFS